MFWFWDVFAATQWPSQFLQCRSDIFRLWVHYVLVACLKDGGWCDITAVADFTFPDLCLFLCVPLGMKSFRDNIVDLRLQKLWLFSQLLLQAFTQFLQHTRSISALPSLGATSGMVSSMDCRISTCAKIMVLKLWVTVKIPHHSKTRVNPRASKIIASQMLRRLLIIAVVTGFASLT